MSDADRPLVVFLRPGPHPYANSSLPRALEAAGFEVAVVDVVDRLRRRRSTVARLGAAALASYGVGIARGRYRAKDALLRTPQAARALRREVLEAVAELDPARPFVTLQIQSLFDGHVPGVPHFVYTDHTHLANLSYPSFDARSLYSRSWIECEREIYAAASTVFVRSTHVARSLAEDYSVDPATVVLAYAGPNADVADGRLADPAASQGVVFVGVDWERKGGPELVEAFVAARRDHAAATLTVVGCEPAAVEGMRVLGRVPLAEVSAALSEAGVFCLPTRVEPFGVAVVEAMRHGLPVVGTAVGAVPDLVEDGVNGALVPPGDTEALADALRRLLADPDLRRTAGERSREIAADRYTWAGVVGRMRPVLDDALARGAAA